MVNGTFRCLGPCAYIKNKFGTGYEIEIKVNVPSNAQLQERKRMLQNPQSIVFNLEY
jgi:hypothetical protein